MWKFLSLVTISAVFFMYAETLVAEKLGIGRLALPEEIAAWDWEITPDGRGLPVGSGDAIEGEEVFAELCASCHGDFAEGMGRWPELAGGIDTLADEDPLKTVGSYWPYVSTVVDYVKRSMPFGYAGSLTDDEVYASVAYILYSNDLIEDDFVLSNETVFDVEMPNSNGFLIDDRVTTEYEQWSGFEPCMTDCKASVEITMRARVLDVTPIETEDKIIETNINENYKELENKAQKKMSKIALYDANLAEDGKKVFKKCKSCHQIGEEAKNRSGPILNNIIGAQFASVPGYKYSSAFKKANKAGLIWTEEEMAKFLTKPKKYLKGTKMYFAGLKKESDATAVIEYLKSVGIKK